MSGAARRGVAYLVGGATGADELRCERARVLVASADEVVEAPHDADAIVELALAGRSVVVVHAGDPYVDGSGSELALRLRAARVPFEVVSSAPLAVAACAAAGIPVVHGELARSVTIADARADRELDWAWLARTPGSLALTVDPSLAARAASALIDAGMAPSQPCALVSRGSTSAQRVVPGTLSTIVRDGAGAQLEAPLVLAVGESVALREHLAWLERRPLFGTRIAVTRAHAQAGELASLLRELGATVAQVPAIAVERLDDAALDAGIDSLRDAQTVVFTSRNGVDVTFARLAERGLDARAFGGVRHLACVGGSTAAALAEHGLVADIVPEAGRRTATGLLDALLEQPLFGTRCTIFRAQVGDERLPDGLRRVDVDVTLVPAYRTLAEPLTAAQVDELLACDAVTFTSASTVASIVALAGDAARVPPCVTIGAPTTQAAVEAGVRVLQQAADATMPALVEAVVERALDNQGVRPWRHAAASAPQVPVSS